MELAHGCVDCRRFQGVEGHEEELAELEKQREEERRRAEAEENAQHPSQPEPQPPKDEIPH